MKGSPTLQKCHRHVVLTLADEEVVCSILSVALMSNPAVEVGCGSLSGSRQDCSSTSYTYFVYGRRHARLGKAAVTQILERDIRAWAKSRNNNPNPFVWTKTAD